MERVSIRELRNHGGEVVDRVTASGGRAVITRNGDEVAELRPLPKQVLGAEELLKRYRNVPPIEPGRLRADIDELMDSSL